MTLTLNVERREESPDSLALCADNGRESVILAYFVTEAAAKTFLDALNAARAVSHAMGALGI